MPGVPARASHDDKRADAPNLYAALDLATGKVIGSLRARHPAIEFRKFLATIDREVPPLVRRVHRHETAPRHPPHRPRAQHQHPRLDQHPAHGLAIALRLLKVDRVSSLTEPIRAGDLGHLPWLAGRRGSRAVRWPVREVRASVGGGFVYPVCGRSGRRRACRRTRPPHTGLDEDGDVVGLS
jgi:hypothetical protein